MTKRSREDKRRLAKIIAIVAVVLFAWSFIASPQAALTADSDVIEPASLAAYDATADASPIRGLIQHNVYLVEAEPAIAHSTSEISLPSQATSTTWLLDMGLLNGAHGTTTGNKVPTETTATQPGGTPSEEFVVNRTSPGNDTTMRFGAGVARSSAEHSDRPRGYGHAYLANLMLLPAPGTADNPPGTYDPEGDAAKEKEHPAPVPSGSPTPNDPNAYTPNPKGQMAILAIGSVASTSETFREEGKAISIAVAELNGINIGNRTADGRCVNCITIDSMRVEARAESDGTKEGALARTRILIHRACRVAITNDAKTGAAYEGVQCLDPNPDQIIEARDEASFRDSIEDPDARGVRKIVTLEQLNAGFAQLAKGLGVSSIGISLDAGTDQDNVTSVTPSQTSATARGLVLTLFTTAAAETLTRIAPNLAPLIQAGDTACNAVADASKSVPPPPAPAPAVAVPGACASGAVQSGQSIRTIRLALGHVQVGAKALLGTAPGGEGGGPEPGLPQIQIPSFNIPSFNIPAQTGGGGDTYYTTGGVSGPLTMKIDWSSVRLKPWKPKDMAKGFFAAGLVGLMVMMIRRRRALR